MPQLVKRGKYVFGWSKVSKKGGIRLPDEAAEEYQLNLSDRVFVMSGSKTSGGFSIIKENVFLDSSLAVILENNDSLASFAIEKGRTIQLGSRKICWTEIMGNTSIQLPLDTLESFGVMPDDHLLSVRGSGLGVGLIVKGPIIEEAKNHPELILVE